MAPRTRNSIAKSVLPHPAPPQISVGRPRGRPPSVTSSRPRMPDGTLASWALAAARVAAFRDDASARFLDGNSVRVEESAIDSPCLLWRVDRCPCAVCSKHLTIAEVPRLDRQICGHLLTPFSAASPSLTWCPKMLRAERQFARFSGVFKVLLRAIAQSLIGPPLINSRPLGSVLVEFA